MSETQMPAVEVTRDEEQELQSYEFAFHILPTVAEGEVEGIFDALKAHITKAGGVITGEEAPQRFDLAYEIVKYLEGKNRKFSSAYFGWVRFKLDASSLTHLTEEMDGVKELLRYLLIKLTRVEEEHEFRFHDSIVNKKVYTITDEDIVAEEEIVEEIEDVLGDEAVVVVADAMAEVDSEETKETV
jgi:ribosomal protein S6